MLGGGLRLVKALRDTHSAGEPTNKVRPLTAANGEQFNVGSFHQSLDGAASRRPLIMSGQMMVLINEGIQFACPVDVKILCEQSLQVVHENPVPDLPVAGGMGYKGEVSTRRNLEVGSFKVRQISSTPKIFFAR